MAKIVQLCSVADAVEAHAIRAILAEVGIHAEIVGESVGAGAGIAFIGEPARPRLWVKEDDLERARQMLDQWSRQVQTRVGEAVPEYGEETYENCCTFTRILVRIGYWMIGGLSTLFVVFLLVFPFGLRAIQGRPDLAEIAEWVFCVVVMATVLVLFWRVARLREKRGRH